MINPKNKCIPDYKQQILACVLWGCAFSMSALPLQSTLNTIQSAGPCAGQFTITGAGTVRFFQAFFYDNTCTTLLGVGSIIDNTTGFSFADQQTVRISSQSIYKLATNLGISPAAIGCMKVYINGSAQSSNGVSCSAFTDETCSSASGTCVSSQTNAVAWSNNPTECASNPNIYVANNTSNTFSVCDLAFTSCTNSAAFSANPTTLTNTPRGIAVNNGRAYSTNGTTFPVTVYGAVLNENGALGSFSTALTGYNNLSGITLNNNYVYFTDANGTTSGTGVNKCSVNAATGVLDPCGDSGATGYGVPAFIAFNNGYAYIANGTTGDTQFRSTITKCSVSATTGNLSSCSDSSPGEVAPFAGPRGIGFYNGEAYIANWSQGNGTNITVCDVDAQSGELSNCARNSQTCGSGSSFCFSGPYGIALYNNQLYVSNSGAGANSVAVCSLPLNTDGSANTCTNYNPGSNTFSNPFQINIY